MENQMRMVLDAPILKTHRRFHSMLFPPMNHDNLHTDSTKNNWWVKMEERYAEEYKKKPRGVVQSRNIGAKYLNTSRNCTQHLISAANAIYRRCRRTGSMRAIPASKRIRTASQRECDFSLLRLFSVRSIGYAASCNYVPSK